MFLADIPSTPIQESPSKVTSDSYKSGHAPLGLFPVLFRMRGVRNSFVAHRRKKSQILSKFYSSICIFDYLETYFRINDKSNEQPLMFTNIQLFQLIGLLSEPGGSCSGPFQLDLVSGHSEQRPQRTLQLDSLSTVPHLITFFP